VRIFCPCVRVACSACHAEASRWRRPVFCGVRRVFCSGPRRVVREWASHSANLSSAEALGLVKGDVPPAVRLPR